jgi:peroxiredoxin
VFYRGAWCPYCNLTLRAYQRELVPALSKEGIRLIAISPQTPDGSLTIRDAHELTFAVLSDPGNQIAGALGIVTRPPADVVALARAGGIDYSVVNADGTDAMPMPTTVLVDGRGGIEMIDIHPNFATRTEPREILGAVAGLADRHSHVAPETKSSRD